MSILCYHEVDPAWRSPLAVSPDRFARHCAWLSRHRRMISLEDALPALDGSGRWPGRLTALSFDDGFAGLYRHALPILLRYQLPATVFIVAQTLTSGGRTVDWVDDPPSWPLTTLSREQVLEMRAAGVSFGSHSFSHRDLTTLNEDECERDLRTSREVLEEVLGDPVRLLAYPRGRHNKAVRAAAARAGFSHAFALPDGPEPIGPQAVPRAGVWSGDGDVALAVKSTNAYMTLRTSPIFGIVRTARHLVRRQRSG
jgi:peptidoglycan/xylan/chitin deacetylase (PgdA/CDA1 family)